MAEVYKSKWILTATEKESDFEQFYENSAMIVSDGKIEDILPSADIIDEDYEKVVDFGNAIITPGFVDLNANLQYFGILDEDLVKNNFKKILLSLKQFFCMLGVPLNSSLMRRSVIEKEYRSLVKPQKMTLFKNGLKSALLSGSTCVVQRCQNDNLIKNYFEILNKAPLKTFLLFEMCSHSIDSTKKRFFKIKKLINKFQKKAFDSMYFGFFPNSIFTVHKNLWRILGRYSRKNKFILITSLLETKEDFELVKTGNSYLEEYFTFCGNKKVKYEKEESPVKYLKDLRVLGENLIIQGGNYLTNDELSILNDCGVNIAYNSLKNNNEVDMEKTLPHDILLRYFPQKIALVKDFFDAIESKNLLEEIYKIEPIVPVEELIKYITLYPAKMLGVSKIIGSLDCNKHADFNVFKLDKKQKMLTDLRYKKAPDEVYILGKQVVKDGEFKV